MIKKMYCMAAFNHEIPRVAGRRCPTPWNDYGRAYIHRLSFIHFDAS